MKYQSLEKVFEAFNGLTVLVIGDVMLDSYIWGSVDRISPEAPVPIVRVRKRDYRLGGAANVALNVQGLGAKPILCALIGDDDAGMKLLGCLDQQRMSKEGIVVSRNRPTTIKTRLIASHQHVVRVDEESDQELLKDEEAQLLKQIEELMAQCDAIIFEDYDKGVINASLIEKTVALARKKNIPTIVDPKKRNFLDYKEVTLFKPNLKELREGLKLDVDASDSKQVEKAVDKLKSLLNAGVMVTLSEHGVYIDYLSQKKRFEAHKREIADVSGAGDTVVSIAGLCVALGLPPGFIAALSNLGGGLVCEHTGVVPINKKELLKESIEMRLDAHLANT
ncbi:MAG TPA: D-glycero-beta-D-manno-heptose-7-phosphate kinase [Cytophagales bacterium]|nr:D-glycero-beta-D-manno-heptose-7-phosphate kinase [Cytophagales bacterium]HCR54580.1 D-glycero-beta-D-manno-heptose-7-phosphate kinase [Cytophagales bacterium]